MIILYTYRHDKLKGLELRYSIRSMVKYFTDLSGIIISGDKPEWYTGDHVQCSDVHGKPGISICNKIVAACPDDNFLWAADDHFALKPFGADLPNYYNGTVQQAIMKQGDPAIKRMLRQCPKGWLSFMVHCPMVMNGVKFKECYTGTEYPVKTMYANYHNLPPTPTADVKIRSGMGYAQIRERIGSKIFFSTHEGAMNDDMIRVMNESYPELTEYER